MEEILEPGKAKWEMKSMRRLLLIVASDGTGYHGWQSQPAQLTVQGKLQEVLSDVLGVVTPLQNEHFGGPS